MRKINIIFSLIFLLMSMTNNLEIKAATSSVTKIADGAIGGEKILIKAKGKLGTVELVDTATGERFPAVQTRANKNGRKAEYQLPFSRRDINRLDITVTRGDDEVVSRAFALVNNNDVLPEQSADDAAVADFGDELFNDVPVIPAVEIGIVQDDDGNNNGNSTGGGGGRGAKGETGDSFFTFDEADQIVSNKEGDTFVFRDPADLNTKLAYYADKNSLVMVNGGASAPGAALVGENSVAIGEGTTQATGDNALAFGENAQASGDNALAFGKDTQALSGGAIAIGSLAKAEGASSVAIGAAAEAKGSLATSLGFGNIADGQGVTAVGSGNFVSGAQVGDFISRSVAIGSNNAVEAGFAFAAGRGNDIGKLSSGAMILGRDSTVEANNQQAVVLGHNNLIPANTGFFTHAYGRNVINNRANTIKIGSNDTQTANTAITVTGGSGGVAGEVELGNAMSLAELTVTPAAPAVGAKLYAVADALCSILSNGTVTRIAGTGNCSPVAARRRR